jgi:hypothetical protein
MSLLVASISLVMLSLMKTFILLRPCILTPVPFSNAEILLLPTTTPNESAQNIDDHLAPIVPVTVPLSVALQDPTDAAENSLQNDAPTPQTSAAETAENDELGAGSEADSGEHSSPAGADSEEDPPAPPSPSVPFSSSASASPRAASRPGSVSPHV